MVVKRFFLCMVAAGLLAGCSSGGGDARVISTPHVDGKSRSEPVFYNGKHYNVSFRYRATNKAYDVNVAGKGGRRLGGEPGDRRVVEQIGSSTVRYFACADGQKARIMPGSSRHNGKSWNMSAQCS